MSRAMGSSCVFTCWGAASWHGGRVMLVFGALAAAGAGSCAGGVQVGGETVPGDFWRRGDGGGRGALGCMLEQFFGSVCTGLVF